MQEICGEIEGVDGGFKFWKKYNNDNKLIFYRDSLGYNYRIDYDSNGKEVSFINSDGHEEYYDHDFNGNLLWMKHINIGEEDFEEWWNYDENGELVNYRNSEDDRICYKV